LDYFWPLAAIWATFGALLTGVVLRKLDISRTSYREARQMLSAMLSSVSARLHQNETLTRQLLEQLQVLKADHARARAEAPTVDTDRLVWYMQQGTGNMRGFEEKVDQVEKNLKVMREEIKEIRTRVDRLSEWQGAENADHAIAVGLLTEDSLNKLSQTERGVLDLLVSGPKPAPEIGPVVGKSREHTARLMKSLFQQGFVERETDRQPYEYRLNSKVREALVKTAPRQVTQTER